jgi:predicted nucleic acid-binding protein
VGRESRSFVDTNIFLRFFANDLPDKAERARSLIASFDSGEISAVTSAAVIFEVAYTLRSYYRRSRRETRDAIEFMLSLPGLEVERHAELSEAIRLFDEERVSLADAFNALYMRSLGIREIYSLDEDFDRFPWVERRDPE